MLVGFGFKDFTYKEYNDGGQLLDREDGVLPGIVLEVARTAGDWRLSANLTGFMGRAYYAGQTQTGIPLSTDTDERMRSLSLRLARRLDIGGGRRVTPYAGYGYHDWRRDIRPGRTAGGTPVSGLLEVYSWQTAELGALVRVGSWGRLEGEVDGRVLRVLDPAMNVRLPGTAGETRFALGERTGGRLGVLGTYALDAGLRLRLEAYHEWWSFGRSPVVSGFLEPRSDTRNTGLTVGLLRSF